MSSTGRPHDRDDDFEEHADLPPTLVDRILTLQRFQEEETELLMAYKVERLQLEAKFQQLRVPLYDKRAAVINGKNSVPVPQIAPGHASSTGKEPQFTSIPGFWLQVLANHPSIGPYIEERDADVLAALEDIRCEYSEDMSSFTLKFTFADNEYFSNKELLKEYFVDPDLLDDQCPTLASIAAPTPVEWRAVERNVTLGKDPEGSLYAPTMSFFHFFDAPRADVDVGVDGVGEGGRGSMRAASSSGRDSSMSAVRTESVAAEEADGAGGRGVSMSSFGLGSGGGSARGSLSTTGAMIARMVDTSSGVLDIGGSANGPGTTIDLLKLTIPLDYEMAHIIRTSIIPFAVGWYTGAMVDDEEEED